MFGVDTHLSQHVTRAIDDLNLLGVSTVALTCSRTCAQDWGACILPMI
jgi:hypothetical protein